MKYDIPIQQGDTNATFERYCLDGPIWFYSGNLHRCGTVIPIIQAVRDHVHRNFEFDTAKERDFVFEYLRDGKDLAPPSGSAISMLGGDEAKLPIATLVIKDEPGCHNGFHDYGTGQYCRKCRRKR
jgi:hypothetical protein